MYYRKSTKNFWAKVFKPHAPDVYAHSAYLLSLKVEKKQAGFNLTMMIKIRRQFNGVEVREN